MSLRCLREGKRADMEQRWRQSCLARMSSSKAGQGWSFDARPPNHLIARTQRPSFSETGSGEKNTSGVEDPEVVEGVTVITNTVLITCWTGLGMLTRGRPPVGVTAGSNAPDPLTSAPTSVSVALFQPVGWAPGAKVA